METIEEQIDRNNKNLATVMEAQSAKEMIMKNMICTYLDAFEAVFDSDESFWAHGQMIDYLTTANWMYANFGRPLSHSRRVQEKLDSLPFI